MFCELLPAINGEENKYANNKIAQLKKSFLENVEKCNLDMTNKKIETKISKALTILA